MNLPVQAYQSPPHKWYEKGNSWKVYILTTALNQKYFILQFRLGGRNND